MSNKTKTNLLLESRISIMEKEVSGKNKKQYFNIWAPVEFCVFFYEKVYNLIERILIEKYVSKVPSKVWTAICGLILFVLYAFLDNMVYWEHYRYYVIVTMAAVYLICIVMIAARNIPGKLEDSGTEGFIKDEYSFIHNKLLWVFIVMSFLMMISEYFINQERGFIGQFNILAIGFLAYVMFRTNSQRLLYNGIKWSILFNFCITTVRVIFFQANIATDSYWKGLTGPYINANGFASSLATAIAVIMFLFVKINNANDNNRFYLLKYFIVCLLIGELSFLIWASKSRTGILALSFTLLISLINLFKTKKDFHKKIVGIVVIAFTSSIVWLLSIHIINEYTRAYEEEKLRLQNVYLTEVKASERLEYYLREKPSLDNFSSGRLSLYCDYLNNINIIGHKDFLLEKSGDGQAPVPAHNSIIGILYKYGLFAGILYFVFAVYVLVYGTRYAIYISKIQVEKYGIMLFYILVCFGCFAMFDTLDERPFMWNIWLLGYVMVAILLAECSYGQKKVVNWEGKEHKALTKIVILLLIIILHLSKFGYQEISKQINKINNAPYRLVLDDYCNDENRIFNHIEGCHGIEGSINNYQMWMGKKVDAIIKKDSNCSKLIIKGYIPYDCYCFESSEDICVKIKLNNKLVYSETFDDNGYFIFDILLDDINGEFIRINISTDKDFVPSEVSQSQDNRTLSWLFDSIIQE